MKKILLATLTAAALLACQRASAIAITVVGNPDFPAKDLPSLGDDDLLAFVQSEAASHQLPAPTTDVSPYTGGAVAAGDYLLLHYGAGTGGSPQGGLVLIYFNADQASYDVPQTGSGPNGLGGLSGAFLYDHGGTTVPDAGSTLALLGIALGFLGMARRKVTAS
jgi:hypothetical protein